MAQHEPPQIFEHRQLHLTSTPTPRLALPSPTPFAGLVSGAVQFGYFVHGEAGHALVQLGVARHTPLRQGRRQRLMVVVLRMDIL
jgi:hypothetical protein